MVRFNALWQSPWFWVPATAICCAWLCAVSSLYPELYALGWVAFVPFLLGLWRCRSGWQAYGYGLFTGFLVFAFSTYWMAEFIRIFKEYSIMHSASLASLYWFFLAQMFGIIAVLTRYGQRGGAMLWVFPTVLTLVFAFYPAIFPWQLGNAQTEFLVALQATDITGVSGLDFMIGLVNVLIAQALIGRSLFYQRSVFAAYALVAGWFIYGVVSLAYWDRSIEQWDTLKVGLVQPDEPPINGSENASLGFSLAYPVEMDLTEQLVDAGADLVVWPEYDRQFYDQPYIQVAYRRQVASLQSALLFQSVEKIKEDNGHTTKYNTVTLLNESGEQAGKYRKMKRIPLAEYLPYFENSETVKNWFRLTTGEFYGSYSAGPEPKSLNLGKATVQPFICYEITFPSFVADSVNATNGDILTTQSNNGWFGDTRVPFQHRAASVLRSVENRRPLVHVMNNGLGVVALPSGRILLHTAPKEVAGYLVDLPYRTDGITTLFTRFSYWFLTVLGLAFVVIMVRAERAKITGSQ